MEKSTKELAKDFSGATAGEFEPDPNLDSVGMIAEKTGIELDPEAPLNVYEKLKERDNNRLNESNSILKLR